MLRVDTTNYESRDRKINSDELIRRLKQFKNSLFHDNVKYENIESFVKKYAFEDLQKCFPQLTPSKKDKLLLEFGYLSLGPIYKDFRTIEKDNFKGFRQYTQENSDLELTTLGKEWKEIVDGFDENIVRCIGRLTFHNMWMDKRKDYISFSPHKKVEICSNDRSKTIDSKIDRNVSEEEINILKRVIKYMTGTPRLD